jgi:tetratricopeptide (TPR) repeat protein
MKNFLLLAMIAATVTAGAQSIDDIRTYSLLGQQAKAKEAVDKYLAIEKNAKKPEGWFYKGYIYNQESKEPTKSLAESIALKAEAFEALKKYRSLDPKASLLAEQNNSPLFDIYIGYSTEIGVKAYEQKDPATAFEGFKRALEVHDYIYDNNLTGAGGFKFSAIDTTLTLYAGIAANEAKKADEGAVYYKKLADANIADPQYVDVYQTLADYYKNKKDKTAFLDILDKAKKLYPKNEEYWTALEIEDAVEGVQRPAVFERYEALLAKYPKNYIVAYNYSVELYQYIYSDEMKNTNTSEYKKKLVETIKKAVDNKATVEANFLAANYLYNNSIDISEEARKIKGPKPEDLKKKKALEAESLQNLDQAIPYAQAVLDLFPSIAKPKASEKANYRQALSILKNAYDIKKDTAKAAQYDKMLKEAE